MPSIPNFINSGECGSNFVSRRRHSDEALENKPYSIVLVYLHNNIFSVSVVGIIIIIIILDVIVLSNTPAGHDEHYKKT